MAVVNDVPIFSSTGQNTRSPNVKNLKKMTHISRDHGLCGDLIYCQRLRHAAWTDGRTSCRHSTPTSFWCMLTTTKSEKASRWLKESIQFFSSFEYLKQNNSKQTTSSMHIIYGLDEYNSFMHHSYRKSRMFVTSSASAAAAALTVNDDVMTVESRNTSICRRRPPFPVFSRPTMLLRHFRYQ